WLSMLSIAVSNKLQNAQFRHPAGPLELGRSPQGSLPRLLIQDGVVSRNHLGVEELPGDRIRVTSLSRRSPASLPDGTTIPPSGVQDRSLPLRVMVGETTVELRPSAGAVQQVEA